VKQREWMVDHHSGIWDSVDRNVNKPVFSLKGDSEPQLDNKVLVKLIVEIWKWWILNRTEPEQPALRI
jgi:hypothetical protein